MTDDIQGIDGDFFKALGIDKKIEFYVAVYSFTPGSIPSPDPKNAFQNQLFYPPSL